MTLCQWRGYHVLGGNGFGTGAQQCVFSNMCRDCGWQQPVADATQKVERP